MTWSRLRREADEGRSTATYAARRVPRWLFTIGWWLGARGALCALMGVVWITYGWGVWSGVTLVRADGPHEALPALARALVWWITGTAAIVWGRSQRWSSVVLGGLVFMPTMRLVSFALALTQRGATRAEWYAIGVHLLPFGLPVIVALYVPTVLTLPASPRRQA